MTSGDQSFHLYSKKSQHLFDRSTSYFVQAPAVCLYIPVQSVGRYGESTACIDSRNLIVQGNQVMEIIGNVSELSLLCGLGW